MPNVLLRQRDQPLAGLDRRYAQVPGEQTAGQLPGPTANLKHPIAGTESRDLADVIQQHVRVCRAVTVVLFRDLVEHLAIAALKSAVRHRGNVDRVADDRTRQRCISARRTVGRSS